jgi:dipeptidyl aminopeptidase/acylaminoacyl peptidase
MFHHLLPICKRAVMAAGALLSIGFLAGLASAPAQDAAAAPERKRIEKVLREMSRGRTFGQVAVAPDGKRLAWIEWENGGVEIRVAPLSNLKRNERITAAAKPEQHCLEENLAWAPDGQSLAFFSDCRKPGRQTDLYLWQPDGAPARRLTELTGYADAPAFSPDGSKVAFLYVEGATRPAGALAAMKPPAGAIGEEGIEVQRVAMAPVDAVRPEAPETVSPANLHVYEFDWRPDSKGLAYVAADPPGENNWWIAKLFTQALNGAPRIVLAPAQVAGPLHGLQIAVPRWSPDGKAIAFIGGLMSDQGVNGGDLWTVSATGGQPVDLTPDRRTSAAWFEWDGNESIYANEFAGGNSQLILLRLHAEEDGAIRASVHGPVYCIPASVGDGRMEMSLSSTADRSLFVFRASSFDRPMEIYAAHPEMATSACAGSDSGNLTQLSHANDGLAPVWGKSVSLEWKSEQFRVQGWLMLPKDFSPAKRYPLIVLVHGGPAAAVDAHWGANGGMSAAAFSAMGYFVLQPNPRGSFGQGEAFTQANRKDFGYGDLRDVLAGVDKVLAQYPVDPQRLGIAGWSYGGFMSMFAVTQTGRFKAAVAGAGISDWKSYYGENSIDRWMLPYFGASVYDDPAIYARSSAIDFIRQAATPTLLLVGDRDGECPAPQSFEFWHALHSRGVPTQLVVYPNEGHGFVDPQHRIDAMERAIEWFDRYLRSSL